MSQGNPPVPERTKAEGPADGTDSDHSQLLYEAWCVIANVGWHQGGWGAQHPEWLAAAIRWRDGWHAWLDSHQPKTLTEFEDAPTEGEP